jgi:hypothetical protein
VTLGAFPEPISIYEGQVEIKAKVKIRDGAEAGTVDLVFEVDTQACDDRSCLAPEKHILQLPVEIAPAR